MYYDVSSSSEEDPVGLVTYSVHVFPKGVALGLRSECRSILNVLLLWPAYLLVL